MTGEWPETDIDHKDSNPFNNIWCNLRKVTGSQNHANTRIAKNNTSGYKGVCWHKREKKWQAAITVNNKCIHLGRFSSPEEAAMAYDQAALKYNGEFARINYSTLEGSNQATAGNANISAGKYVIIKSKCRFPWITGGVVIFVHEQAEYIDVTAAGTVSIKDVLWTGSSERGEELISSFKRESLDFQNKVTTLRKHYTNRVLELNPLVGEWISEESNVTKDFV